MYVQLPGMKKRKEKRFELRLSNEGDAALAQIEEATGLSRAAIIEMALREEARRRQSRAVSADNRLAETLAERGRLYPDAPQEIIIGDRKHAWRSGPLPKPGQKGKR